MSNSDFFISYNHADEAWAIWIAGVLEQANYTTTYQARDFPPGSNFVVEMQKAVRTTARTIAVLSPNFLKSDFTAAEWAAAFADDPAGTRRKLIPVRVASYDDAGLLGQIVRIDLMNKTGAEAQQALLAGIGLSSEKSSALPLFPGASTASASAGIPDPVSSEISDDILWKVLRDHVDVSWFVLDDRYQSGTSVVEVQLIPVQPQRIEVRKLNALPEELAGLARASGLVPSSLAISTAASETSAIARTDPLSRALNAGLGVTRTGHRGGWLELPHDSMGAVLDSADLTSRVVALLKLLNDVSVPEPDDYAIAIGLSSTMMLTIDKIEVVGRRSSATFQQLSQEALQIQPEEAVSASGLRSHLDDVAEELVARVVARLRSRN